MPSSRTDDDKQLRRTRLRRSCFSWPSRTALRLRPIISHVDSLQGTNPPFVPFIPVAFDISRRNTVRKRKARREKAMDVSMPRRSYDSDSTVVADSTHDGYEDKAKLDGGRHIIPSNPFQLVANAAHVVTNSVFRRLSYRSPSAPRTTDNLIRALQKRQTASPAVVVDLIWRAALANSGELELIEGLPPSLALHLLSRPQKSWSEVWGSAVTAIRGTLVQSEHNDSLSAEHKTKEETRYRALTILLYDARYSLSDVGAQFIYDLLSQAHDAPHALSGWRLSCQVFPQYGTFESPRGDAIATLLLETLATRSDIPQCAPCVGAALKSLLGFTWQSGKLLAHARQLRCLLSARHLTCNTDVSVVPQSPDSVENLLALLVLRRTQCHDVNMPATSVARSILFQGPEFMYNYIHAASARRVEERLHREDRCVFKFTEVFCESSLSERRTLLQSARKMCELYCDGLFSDRRFFAEKDLVQVCVLFVETQKTLEEQSDEPDKQTRKLWWDFWEAFSACLRKYRLHTQHFGSCPAQNRTAHQAGRCLETISTWNERGRHVLQHPDELFRALESFAFRMDVSICSDLRAKVTRRPVLEKCAVEIAPSDEDEAFLMRSFLELQASCDNYFSSVFSRRARRPADKPGSTSGAQGVRAGPSESSCIE